MVVCKSGDLAEHFRLQRAFGVSKIHSDRQTPGNYDVLEIGFNYRMAEIPAAIGIVTQLAKVDNFLKCRKQNFSRSLENCWRAWILLLCIFQIFQTSVLITLQK